MSEKHTTEPEHAEEMRLQESPTDEQSNEQSNKQSNKQTRPDTESTKEAEPTSETQTGESGQTAEAQDSQEAAQDQDAGRKKPAGAIRRFMNAHIPDDVTNALTTWGSRIAKPFAVVGRVLKKIWRGWEPFTHILLYIVVFCLATTAAIYMLQLSVYKTDDSQGRFLFAAKFITKMWDSQQYQFMMNFIIAGLFYAFIIFLVNRFWIATAIFIIIASVAATANYFKVSMRQEPIIPADLTFLNGNTGEIVSFIPNGSGKLLRGIIVALAIFTALCIVFYILDNHKRIIHAKRFKAAAITSRIALILTPVLCLGFLGNTLGAQNSWTYNTAKNTFTVFPILWNSYSDAMANGPLVNFTRLMYHKAMDQPEGYSKETMEALAKRYTTEANAINQTRSADMTDSTVIMMLSESYSDPTRVPGVTFTEDPMPNIRALKGTTTSGLMLSPGYGGGTANIEYQSLTGLSLVNFNPSLAVPYQQLVPSQKWAPTFNQIWNDAYGAESGSQAIHPYYKRMYLRDTNYKKFGFSKFWTLEEPNVVTHQDTLGTSPYVSDASTYQNILDMLNKSKKNPQFLQIVTMQNHMPYTDWYPDNQFFSTDTSGLPDSERYLIDTYAKGVSITDQETADFLDKLNQIDKPITVIFYGDHLPGIYPTADSDSNNAVTLHETDYFIWSNQASSSAGVKLPEQETAYTSSNYFMSLAAEHMNAKVSPYLAMLTELRAQVPAMNTLIPDAGGIGTGEATYLDSNGQVIDISKLSKKAKKLLEDYKLVQYDMTVGKGYLKDYGFVEVPSANGKS
ncbi:LTA synthase family protein [Bifidobacterium miconisargentati]|uniref:LTA synthase family protein n=1 Tax=Bifidobacterium miconisargentati TaxID=2834437 RepID=UPI001BDD85DF|nr:LTA synthase family protein [Bifidobacterium miconisargentati]MBW3091159.1 LTA synthase family protein [Bifidobacterium miconisargentati]